MQVCETVTKQTVLLLYASFDKKLAISNGIEQSIYNRIIMEFNKTSMGCMQMVEPKTPNEVVAYMLYITLIIIIKVMILNSYVKLETKARHNDTSERNSKICV